MAVGYIQTSDQAKKFLQDMRNATGSRSFGSLYAANELAGMKAEQQVEQQYGEQIGQAYKSAMAQRQTSCQAILAQDIRKQCSVILTSICLRLMTST